VEQHYLILTQFNKQNFFVHQAADFSKIFQRFYFSKEFFKPPIASAKNYVFTI